MRAVLVLQPARSSSRSRIARLCMAAIATRVTTVVNRREHSSAPAATREWYFRALPLT